MVSKLLLICVSTLLLNCSLLRWLLWTSLVKMKRFLHECEHVNRWVLCEISRRYLLLPECGTYSKQEVVKYFARPQVRTSPSVFVFLSAQCCINFLQKCMKRFMATRADSTLSTQGKTSLLYSSTYFGLLSYILVLNVFTCVSARPFLIVHLSTYCCEVFKNGQ